MQGHVEGRLCVSTAEEGVVARTVADLIFASTDGKSVTAKTVEALAFVSMASARIAARYE